MLKATMLQLRLTTVIQIKPDRLVALPSRARQDLPEMLAKMVKMVMLERMVLSEKTLSTTQRRTAVAPAGTGEVIQLSPPFQPYQDFQDRQDIQVYQDQTVKLAIRVQKDRTEWTLLMGLAAILVSQESRVLLETTVDRVARAATQLVESESQVTTASQAQGVQPVRRGQLAAVLLHQVRLAFLGLQAALELLARTHHMARTVSQDHMVLSVRTRITALVLSSR